MSNAEPIKRNVIGPRVRELRLAAEMSQYDLTDKLRARGSRLFQKDVSFIENQLRSVTDNEVIILAEILGVTTDYLLRGSD